MHSKILTLGPGLYAFVTVQEFFSLSLRDLLCFIGNGDEYEEELNPLGLEKPLMGWIETDNINH